MNNTEIEKEFIKLVNLLTLTDDLEKIFDLIPYTIKEKMLIELESK